MESVTIVYEEGRDDKGNIVPVVYQTIKPSEKFGGDIGGLVEAVSKSNRSLGIKTYKYYYTI